MNFSTQYVIRVVDSLQKDIIASQLNQYTANINAANQSIAILAQQVSSAGASPAFIATGKFYWNDVTTTVTSLANPSLTNKDCATMNSIFNATTLNAKFQQYVSTLLPISADAITITAPITCGPANPVKILNDQASVFTVSFNVSAHYIYFASDASYVSYADPAVDHTLQYLEDVAPLNQINVLDAVNNALHALMLEATEAWLSAFASEA